MKSITKQLMCLLCILLLLCACAEGTVETESRFLESSGVVSTEDTAEQSSEEVIGGSESPMPEHALFRDATVKETEVDGGVFRVEQIKKRYHEEELVLLHIVNQTDNDYCVTIDGSYHDENGKVIKRERQTFIQYYAGYENYFIFRPKTEFAEFSYTLSFEEAIDITVEDFFGNIRHVRADDVSYRFSHTEEHLLHIEPLVIRENDQNRHPITGKHVVRRYTQCFSDIPDGKEYPCFARTIYG